MDHSRIDEDLVAERYLQGKLPPAAAAAFEEHSLGCPDCLDRLEAASRLGLGLREVAAHEVAREVVGRSLVARLARSRLAAAGVLALGVAALLPASLLWRQVGGLQRDLAAAHAALRQRPEPAGPREAAGALAALRAAADEQGRQLSALRGERNSLAADLERSRAPRVNLPVLSLSPERSGPEGEPATRLALPEGADWAVFALDLGAVEYPEYRATLAAPDRTILWQGAGLRPSAQDTLTVALPSSLLRPGDLVLRVTAAGARGNPVAVATYTFRVESGRSTIEKGKQR